MNCRERPGLFYPQFGYVVCAPCQAVVDTVIDQQHRIERIGVMTAGRARLGR